MEHDTRLPPPRTILLAATATVALTFAAFGRSLLQGFAPADDSFLIVHNLAAHGINLRSLRLAFQTYDPELYIPLTLVSFQINWIWSGLHAWSYHLTNILLHAGNALLVMWLLWFLPHPQPFSSAEEKGAVCVFVNTHQTSNTNNSPLLRTGEGQGVRSGNEVLAVFLAGLLFAIHPLHTEAVAWIAGRKDLLSTFFALLSIIAYVRYREGSKQAYAWSIVTLLLSLLAKMMAVTLPVVFLLYDFLWERRKMNRAFFLDKLPHTLLSVIFGIVTLGGKERILAALSPVETILVAGKSVVFYLEKFLLPVHLGILYPYQGTVSITKPEFFLPLAIVLALLGVLAMLLRRAVSDEGAGRWAFGLLFYLITLSPTLLHARKGEGIFFAVDRYAYLPSVGLALLLALLLQYMFDRYRPRGEALWVPVAIVMTAFTALSVRQTFTWDSAETLYGNVLRIYPESVNARASLASIRRQQGKIQEAFDVLKEGLQYGDDPRLRLHAGFVYAANGDVASAREQFEKVIAMDSRNPEPVFSIGSLLEQTGDPAGAAGKYRAAIDMDPSYVVARVSLARILTAEGKMEEAEEQLRTALRWNPSAADAHVELAKLLQKEGKRDEALAHAQAALEIDEGNGEARGLVKSLLP